MALAMTLIFLLLLTIIGVTAVSMTALEGKMAANMKDSQAAFQASESALREAEDWLRVQTTRVPTGTAPACTTTTTVCGFNVLGDLKDKNKTWWDSNGREYGPTTGSPPDLVVVFTDPRYVIEERDFVPYDRSVPIDYSAPSGNAYYQVTARGWGETETSKSVLQSTYVKGFNF